MKDWQKILLKAIGVGAGLAITLSAIGGILLWQESRPKRPKPWNSKMIIASFDYPDSEVLGPDDHSAHPKLAIVLNYTLENMTDYDYRMPPKDQIEFEAVLRREKSLAGPSSVLTWDEGVFIPARQRRRFSLHLHYPIEVPIESDANTKEAQRKKWKEIADYMKEELPNVNGFSLFDQANRVEILVSERLGFDRSEVRGLAAPTEDG